VSGGKLDYLYFKMEDAAGMIYQEYSPEEEQLSFLLKDLAKVLHDYDWWQSGDVNKKEFLRSYREFKKTWLKGG